ncbi:MAG: DNA primase [Eubacterium sp.]|nr:DNA primase [Eubacterium sp.]
MRENYNIETEENEAHEDNSSWFQKGFLNEILFLDEFLELFPMKNFEGNFYGPDGMIAASTVEHNIYRLLSTQAYSGLANKTKNLFKALALETMTEEFPADMFVVRAKNGSLHMDGTFVEEQNVTRYRLAVPYDPDAPTPWTWLGFLSQLLEDMDILTLQEYLGYCLIPCTKGQSMLFLIGDGGEGKSRITQVCRAIFGKVMNVSSLHKLEKNKFARADLVGKLLMIDDDLEIGTLPSTNYIKSIVTQEGKIDTERKQEQSEQREMTCRLLCMGNGSPGSLYDHSNGFYRRQIILTTLPRPEDRVDDPFLAEKLLEELPGIFLWCFQGLQSLISNNFQFTISEKTKQNLQALKVIGNNTITFIESKDYFSFGEGYSATTSDLYNAYRLWCHENAEVPVAMRSLSSYLKQHAAQLHLTESNNVPNKDGRKVRGFFGIKVDVKTDFVPFQGDLPFAIP